MPIDKNRKWCINHWGEREYVVSFPVATGIVTLCRECAEKDETGKVLLDWGKNKQRDQEEIGG